MLTTLIQLAIGMVRDEVAAKNIQLAHELPAEKSILGSADPARIQQVIWNLLNNAVKYTPPAGRVKIRTRNRQTDDGRLWLRVEVSDTGMGIRPELLEIIFDPFEQASSPAKHRFGGLGLGLSIARAIVQLHRGKIWAESHGPAKGSTFIVELPGATATRPETPGEIDDAQTPHAPVSVARKGPNLQRLLLVEDHPSTLSALAALLSRSGYEVTTAESMADALAVAANKTFDLVVSDLGLPDGTGIQLMEELRSRHGLKGIALSGYGMEEDIARAFRAGFVAHLVKPVRISELRKILEAHSAG